jgi:DNA-binding NarL/FixJ family response regulator
MTTEKDVLIQKVDTLIELVQQIVVLELVRSGVSQAQIGKRIHVATATVGKMLKGVKREK